MAIKQGNRARTRQLESLRATTREKLAHPNEQPAHCNESQKLFKKNKKNRTKCNIKFRTTNETFPLAFLKHYELERSGKLDQGSLF